MKRTLLAGALALVCFVSPVWGDQPPNAGAPVQPVPNRAQGAYSAVTIGITDSTIVVAGSLFDFLDIVNNSSSATVCLNFGSAATFASGTTCAAGEITLPPLWHRSWEGNFVPTDAIHAIASAASTPATVGEK